MTSYKGNFGPILGHKLAHYHLFFGGGWVALALLAKGIPKREG